MFRGVEKMADRLLNVFAPHVVAKADPCSCSGSGSYWGDVCDYVGCSEYRRFWKCNGCQWVGTCKYYRRWC
ncbi:hypothetical protein Vau01_114890 [Virgisporangium aurantiacum]|uniref:Uncharacterized protein n=2 Tax=Virgisporangium aurantiacum TaxID=175570 RepID=A0A8J4E7A0_9ACTN|nr:hypothetical protein Vau01_114890 [Virgisporangium aurantiacum]